MTEDERKARKQKIFKGVMTALMVGSGAFLAERYVLKLDVDTSLIFATGLAVAVAVYLLQKIDET